MLYQCAMPGVISTGKLAPLAHQQARWQPAGQRAVSVVCRGLSRSATWSPRLGGRTLRRSCSTFAMAADKQQQQAPSDAAAAIGWKGVHHVGLLVQDLDKSRQFYEGVLGLKLNPERPDDRLPYGGAWFWLGPEMIHLMVLPNPDPMDGRPEHGGRDRHVAVGVESVPALRARLEEFDISFTQSKSGRQAIFFRDPDQNVLECVELEDWR